MKDPSAAVKKAFYDLLSDIGYPVFTNYVDTDDNAYVLISDININDASSKTRAGYNCSVQAGIYTKSSLRNTDNIVDTVSDLIFDRIYPSTLHKINIEGFHNISIYFESMRSESLQLNSFIAINKFIIFNVNIE